MGRSNRSKVNNKRKRKVQARRKKANKRRREIRRQKQKRLEKESTSDQPKVFGSSSRFGGSQAVTFSSAVQELEAKHDSSDEEEIEILEEGTSVLVHSTPQSKIMFQSIKLHVIIRILTRLSFISNYRRRRGIYFPFG